MRKNVVKDKSFAFAIRIVNLYKYLTNDKKEFVLSKQLLRSGTAIGALIRESEHAESKADFIHKLSIALNYLIQEYQSIKDNIIELLKLLATIIKTSKSTKK